MDDDDWGYGHDDDVHRDADDHHAVVDHSAVDRRRDADDLDAEPYDGPTLFARRWITWAIVGAVLLVVAVAVIGRSL